MSSKTKTNAIIFDTNEVNAALAGCKTQHRVLALTSEQVSAGYKVCYGVASGQVVFTKDEDDDSFENGDYITVNCPFGAIGDQLWVKEDFIPDPPVDHDAWEDEDSVTNYFQWDGCGSKLSEIPKRLRKPEHVIYKASWDDPDGMIWVEASRMRKWSSRLHLEVTDIRIERVQDTTLSDSFKESCDGLMAFAADYWMVKHGAAAWFTNPWVWVIEFKAVQR